MVCWVLLVAVCMARQEWQPERDLEIENFVFKMSYLLACCCSSYLEYEPNIFPPSLRGEPAPPTCLKNALTFSDFAAPNC